MTGQEFIQKVKHFCHKERLWQKGDAILVAVSGGPDSLGLLYFLHSVAKEEGLRLGCCCVNHHLREEAEAEANYVEKIARSLDIPFYLRHVDVKAAQREGKGSLETAARELRYEALREVKVQGHFQSIALAHHANDQAETVLFHLLRGSGSRGLSGISPKREDLIRPFLSVTKADIEAFLQSFSCPSCHDATNDIPDATRNKIRIELMPQLLEYNPHLVSALGHTADILREEDKYMADQAKQWLSVQSYVSQGGYVLLPRKALGHLPIALMRRVLLQAVWQVGQDSLDFQSLERLRTLALLGQSGQKTSSEKVMAQVEGPDFYLYPGTTQHRDEMDKKEVLELLYQKWMQKPVDNIDKTVIIDSNRKQETKGPWQITIRCLSEKPKDLARNQYLLDADQVGALHLSFPEKEDRMAPWGMEGNKRIFRLLQEAHIPCIARADWPLVSDEKHIYWTGLIRGSRWGRPTAKTTHFLCITLWWTGKELEN